MQRLLTRRGLCTALRLWWLSNGQRKVLDEGCVLVHVGRQNQLRAIMARLVLLVPNDKLDCFVLVEFFALNKNNSTF